MPTTSIRQHTITFTGDVVETRTQFSGNNTNSSAQEQLINLSLGANIIGPPGAGGVNSALTIIPPAGNTNLITLKGVGGDTGIPLHKTDPTTIALDTTFVNLVLNAAAVINGVRLIWS